MKLSDLFTKGKISENIAPLGRAFSKMSSMPNPKFIKLDKFVNQVYQDLWSSYHRDPVAQDKLRNFKSGSMRKFYPKLLKIKDKSDLENKIKTLFLNALGST